MHCTGLLHEDVFSARFSFPFLSVIEIEEEDEHYFFGIDLCIVS